MSKAKYYRKSLSKRLSRSAREGFYKRWRSASHFTHLKNLRRFA